MFDAFINYRREGGSHVARTLKLLVEKRADMHLFLDVDALETGRFDTQLLAAIAAAQSFIVILTPGSLDRCSSDGDWLSVGDTTYV